MLKVSEIAENFERALQESGYYESEVYKCEISMGKRIERLTLKVIELNKLVSDELKAQNKLLKDNNKLLKKIHWWATQRGGETPINWGLDSKRTKGE